MKFTETDAQTAAAALGLDFKAAGFSPQDLADGMNEESKHHGPACKMTNITDDDPILTAQIALAHLNESALYYAPKVGVEAWAASLRKGVKKKSVKTEYKTIAFKAEEGDGGSGIFSGYAAVFGNIDSYGDIIEPGAFTKTIAEGTDRVKILALHNDYMLPVGKPIELKEDGTGLYIKAQISDTSLGKDIKLLLRDGVLNELSIGYDPIIFDYDSEGIRHLREVKLWEVSVVTWAANPGALITGYKAKDPPPNQPTKRLFRKADGLIFFSKQGG